MDEQRILDELLALLEANGVAIRNEPLGGSGGGLCTVKGRQIFFVDAQAPSAEVAVLCAIAIARVVDIENLYIKPQVRQFIEAHSPDFIGDPAGGGVMAKSRRIHPS